MQISSLVCKDIQVTRYIKSKWIRLRMVIEIFRARRLNLCHAAVQSCFRWKHQRTSWKSVLELIYTPNLDSASNGGSQHGRKLDRSSGNIRVPLPVFVLVKDGKKTLLPNLHEEPRKPEPLNTNGLKHDKKPCWLMRERSARYGKVAREEERGFSLSKTISLEWKESKTVIPFCPPSYTRQHQINSVSHNDLLSSQTKGTAACRAAFRGLDSTQDANSPVLAVLTALTALRGSAPPAPQDQGEEDLASKVPVMAVCTLPARYQPTSEPFPPASDIHTHLSPTHLVAPTTTWHHLRPPEPPLRARQWPTVAHTENHLL